MICHIAALVDCDIRREHVEVGEWRAWRSSSDPNACGCCGFAARPGCMYIQCTIYLVVEGN